MAGSRRLGLQRRIMLYVTIGLATMFGVGGVVGSAAIDQATGLVFDERLATAYTTAGIIERDFARLAADVHNAAGGGSARRSPGCQGRGSACPIRGGHSRSVPLLHRRRGLPDGR